MSQFIKEDEAMELVKGIGASLGSGFVALVSVIGRVLSIEIRGGEFTCGIISRLEAILSTLEPTRRSEYAVWNCRQVNGLEPRLLIRLIKLDFLDEIRLVMNEVGHLVNQRMKEFRLVRQSEEKLFSELCFCILTANFTASGGLKIQESIGDGFTKLSREELIRNLRNLGHRFAESRADYIVEARRFYGMLNHIISSLKDPERARTWFVENIRGLGYKEASHLLRNIGFEDVAIIDRHVMQFLFEHGLLEQIPRRLSASKYIELEKLLRVIAKKLNVTLGEFDLYIWYVMTGKILK